MQPVGTKLAWRLMIGAALVLAVSATLRAQTIFERLVMPGPLIEGHSKLEKDCKNCHKPFSKSVQRHLCLACHEKVAADFDDGVGFHGRRKDITTTPCKHCHTDHIGRDADIVKLDLETFDHDHTDFALVGSHKTVSCETCHEPKVKFRDAPLACVKCHKEDEPHQGRLGEKCETCHSAESWRQTKPFNHDETKFPLAGAHKEVSCKTCHTGEQYKDLPGECVSCHRLQDVHDGRHGEKCEKCHSSEKWKTIRFDHDKDTEFPLRSKHKEAKCESCHRANVFEEKLSANCVSCHREDDAHKGQQGEDCGKCHKENGWRQDVFFDHDITRFPLIGLHATVPCEECHITQRFKDAPLNCNQCHGKDGHHEGRLGALCSTCHNPNGWALWQFDHDTQTSFPLTGSHTGLDCHACHTEKNVQKVEQSSSCHGCHQRDDVHQGAFGPQCDRCHTTKTFTGTFRGR